MGIVSSLLKNINLASYQWLSILLTQESISNSAWGYFHISWFVTKWLLPFNNFPNLIRKEYGWLRWRSNLIVWRRIRSITMISSWKIKFNLILDEDKMELQYLLHCEDEWQSVNNTCIRLFWISHNSHETEYNSGWSSVFTTQKS